MRWHEAQWRPAALKGQSEVESVSPRRTQLEVPSNSSIPLKKLQRFEPPHDSLAKVLGEGGVTGRKEKGVNWRGRQRREGATRNRKEKKVFFPRFLALKVKSFSHSHFGV